VVEMQGEPIYEPAKLFSKDREGNETNRVVEPRRVWRTRDKDQLMLSGWCHTRRSPRTFYYDGIRDICTGGIGLQYIIQGRDI